jgi:hypothetical protein
MQAHHSGPEGLRLVTANVPKVMKPVDGGMRNNVTIHLDDAAINMSVSTAVVHTGKGTRNAQRYIVPKFLRVFIWDNKEIIDRGSRLATLSLSCTPWPPVPSNIASNTTVQSTLSSHSHLFSIVMPIKVDLFWHLLRDHPNKPFVQSVCESLTSGVWPFASKPDHYPLTYDSYSDHNYTITDPDHIHFLKSK